MSKCKCGCNKATRPWDRGPKRGEPRDFLNGHNRRKHGFTYEVDPATGCWLWQGSLTWNGYGQGKYQGKGILAHRWFYEREHGPISGQLDHLCRRRNCCNPAHLQVVSNAENVRRGNATILTEPQVREIKQASRVRGSGRALARKYGVHVSTISAIRCGRLWADVT